MGTQYITIGDLFLDILAKSQDNRTKYMAEQIKAAIKSPAISELFNICVINLLGFRYKIREKIVDDAVDGLINWEHSNIDCSNLSDKDKGLEKESYKHFAKGLGEAIKENLRETQQLV